MRGLCCEIQFETLSIHARVHKPPDPKIELGPVDDSVSFVVVDATQDDFPVVYCSQNFHRLTGYRREEIMGRNFVRILVSFQIGKLLLLVNFPALLSAPTPRCT